MILTNAKANYGLLASASLSSPTASGSFSLGVASTTLALPGVNAMYAVKALLIGGANEFLQINTSNASGGDSSPWVAGSAQVLSNTIVAAGGCTASGALTLVVRAIGMSGSPVSVPVALTTATHTTAALIAAAARTALAANAAVAAQFTVGGSGAEIMLTRKPFQTYGVGTASVPAYESNDSTANLAIPGNLGVTASATSSGTAGVATSGCYLVGAGEDFEGNPVSLATISGVLIQCENGAVSYANGQAQSLEGDLGAGGVFQVSNPGNSLSVTDPLIITLQASTPALVTLIVAGTSGMPPIGGG